MWLVLLVALTPEEKLVKARQAYDDYEFVQAAKLYKDAEAGLTGAKLEEAYLYHAFASFIARLPDATNTLRKLFKLNPTHKLDTKGLHPDLVKFHESERPIVAAPPPTSPTAAQPLAVKKASAYEPAHIGVRLIPFGVGQFANGDPVAGGVWLGVGVALTATIVTGFAMKQRSNIGGNDYTSDDATTWWYVHTVASAALIGVGIGSVIDAIVWSPKRGEARYNARGLTF